MEESSTHGLTTTLYGGIMMKGLFRKFTAALVAAIMAVTAAPAVYADEAAELVPVEMPVSDSSIEPMMLADMEQEPVNEMIPPEEYEEYLKKWNAQSSDNEVLPDHARESSIGTGHTYYLQFLNDKEKEFYNSVYDELEQFYWSSDEPVLADDGQSGKFGALSFSVDDLTVDRALKICSMVENASRKFFFTNGHAWSTSGKNARISFLITYEFRTRAKINEYRNKIEDLMSEWVPELKTIDEVLEREEAAYGKVLDHVLKYGKIDRVYDDGVTRYDSKGEPEKTWNNQTVAGAFVDKICVCAGYASAVTLLLNSVGIDCLNVGSIPEGNHAFNLVNMYGNWYWLDTTWIDRNTGVGNDSELVDKTSYCVNKSYATFSQNYTNKSHTYNTVYTEEWNIEIPEAVHDIVIDASRTCKVKFTGEGVNIPEQAITWGMSVNEVDAPSVSGYRFGGWFSDAAFTKPYIFGNFIYADTTLYARMTRIQSSDEGMTIEGGVLTGYTGNGGTVTIPEDVISIDFNSLGKTNDKKITAFEVSAENNAFTSIDGVVFTKDKKTLVMFPKAREAKTYTVPAGTTGIGNRACAGIYKTENFIISEGVRTIGDYAFFGSSNLKTITLPESLESIGFQALSYAFGLTGTITVPAGVKAISNYAFAASTKVTDVTINANIASLPVGTFADCSGLVTVTFPASVESIGKYAFKNCTALTDINYGGTKAQWGTIDKTDAEIPSTCRIVCKDGPAPGPTPTTTGKVTAVFGGKTLTVADLTALGKDKTFKAATGDVTITVSDDLTAAAQTFAFPSKATSVTFKGDKAHKISLRSATLTSKGTLTVENLTLISGKKNTGLTAKGAVTIKNSTVGAVKASGTAVITDSTITGKLAAAGELTVTGTQCSEDISMTAKTAKITLDDSTAHKKVTSSGGIVLKNGSIIEGAVKATGILTLSVGTAIKSTANVGGIAIAA